MHDTFTQVWIGRQSGVVRRWEQKFTEDFSEADLATLRYLTAEDHWQRPLKELFGLCCLPVNYARLNWLQANGAVTGTLFWRQHVAVIFAIAAGINVHDDQFSLNILQKAILHGSGQRPAEPGCEALNIPSRPLLAATCMKLPPEAPKKGLKLLASTMAAAYLLGERVRA